MSEQPQSRELGALHQIHYDLQDLTREVRWITIWIKMVVAFTLIAIGVVVIAAIFGT